MIRISKNTRNCARAIQIVALLLQQVMDFTDDLVVGHFFFEIDIVDNRKY